MTRRPADQRTVPQDDVVTTRRDWLAEEFEGHRAYFTVANGRIVAIDLIADQHKLRRLPERAAVAEADVDHS